MSRSSINIVSKAKRNFSCSMPSATDLISVTSKGSKSQLKKPEWLKASPPSGGMNQYSTKSHILIFIFIF